MNAFLGLVRRDLVRSWRGGGAALPVAFFLAVCVLFPFAIGPDARLIGATGAGALWIAALLAALLPIDRLIEPDAEAGVLDQLAARGIADELVAFAKLCGHWLSFAPPLLLAAVPAAALLRLDGNVLARLEAGLAIGTLGLAALAVGVSALTLGLRGVAALAGLLVLPLAVPVLIFGASAAASDAHGALELLAAASLLLVAGAPFVAGAAIRADRG